MANQCKHMLTRRSRPKALPVTSKALIEYCTHVCRLLIPDSQFRGFCEALSFTLHFITPAYQVLRVLPASAFVLRQTT